MHVCLDEDVDAANTIKLKLNILVFTPVAHSAHIFTSCIKLLVALHNDCVFRQAVGEFSSLV
jgi:hypothetical protein